MLGLDEILIRLKNGDGQGQGDGVGIEIRKIVLIPHRFLHLLPLHVIPIRFEEGEMSLSDVVVAGGVCFAPSASVFCALRTRSIFRRIILRESSKNSSDSTIEGGGGGAKIRSIVTVEAGNDLLYSPAEVKAVASYFPSTVSISKHHACAQEFRSSSRLRNALLRANHVHFSCHGVFHFGQPELSCLVLDQGSRLYVGDVSRLYIPQCELVTLSACSTAITDALSDEYVGLSSGFLVAGASAVVASLWPVPERATALLMTKLTELRELEQLSAAEALTRAQSWARNAPMEELIAFVHENRLYPSLDRLASAHPGGVGVGVGSALKVHVVDAADEEGSWGGGSGGGHHLRTSDTDSVDGSVDDNNMLLLVDENEVRNVYSWGGFVVVGGVF